ncbi:MAG: FKBP-type peptidyl-prolyl cis-trans isomerase [Planctomycetota bacterium]
MKTWTAGAVVVVFAVALPASAGPRRPGGTPPGDTGKPAVQAPEARKPDPETKTPAPAPATAPAAVNPDAANPDVKPLADAAFATPEDKYSYVLGLDVGKSLKQVPMTLRIESLSRGIRDALAGTSVLSDAGHQAAFADLRNFLKTQQEVRMKTAGEKNLKEGPVFLAENAKKKGVIALPSGLQYEILAEGAGASPNATDTVTVHYRGTLIDGTEFDSSIKRNTPAQFQVGAVIKGWTEALQLMKVGAKWKLYIPSALAYGDQAKGAIITPNSVLVFEVELLGIGGAAAK